MKSIRILVLLISAYSFFYLSNIAQADSLDSFDVVGDLPDNQLDKTVTYFDLLMKPEEKQTLNLRLTNRLDTPIPLELSFNKALTNGSGVVEYSGNLQDTSTSDTPNIEDLVTLEETSLTLKPKETKAIQLQINMPKETFSGVLAGGLYIKQTASQNEQKGNVTNLLSREIAVLVRTDKTAVKPELKILSASALQANSRNVIEAVVENTTATYISDVTIEAKVTQDGKEVLTDKKENMKIAPTSQFHYRIPLSGTSFEGGTYDVNLKITSGDSQWMGSPSFTIENKEAQSLNRQDVSVQAAKPAIPWSTIILVSVLIIFMIVLWYVMQYNRQLRQSLASKRKKRSHSRRHRQRTS
ncbi:DUF916 and DUF3324 domain-containing protein [Vagococcus sp. BWB3-3]|uniref:DUF916 and DUF3324 domain-containing protein n=1 Tax=Vagococcus allomyrinae TaxID=2794353 RepID=A0A940STC3_9ENTE|nr:DUF916 and DUF3324 domain-containing protein [Vagococcus allomyrinae]MBP1040155.1 DUF916 and DUF3324 domain-containing protein [Vagococcus allomyrinae]